MDHDRIDREMETRNVAMALDIGAATWNGFVRMYFAMWSECMADALRVWEPWLGKKEG